MIRIVPQQPAASTSAAPPTTSAAKVLLRDTAHMVKAEAWQTAAVLNSFAFDPSSMPEPPHTFTTVAGRLARTLYEHWNAQAEPIPRTILSDGATETTWPNRFGVPLFLVEAPDEQRRVYLSSTGFVTARFPHRRVEVSRYGRYTTGLLGGRTARAAAETIGDESVELTPSSFTLWTIDAPCVSAYSVLARTLLAMVAIVLDTCAPEIRARMAAVDFAELMEDAVLRLTVDDVHAL
jgi:hypothetical protein